MKIDWPTLHSIQCFAGCFVLYPKHIFYTNWARYIWKHFYFYTQKKYPDLVKNSILQKPTLKFNKNLEKGGNFGRCKKRNEEQWRSKGNYKVVRICIGCPNMVLVKIQYFLDRGEHFFSKFEEGTKSGLHSCFLSWQKKVLHFWV